MTARVRATASGSSNTTRVPAPRARIPAPDDAVECELRAAGHDIVVGVDEVGRGAWAGPVVVVAAVPGTGSPPDGLTDSKLLDRERREAMFDAVGAWCAAWALGSASPGEIDELGMTAALRLAAVRALSGLPEPPGAVILDGAHDYLGAGWTVRTVVKGDQRCVSVAAASILAKVRRDRLMMGHAADWPLYGFDSNVGYPSPVHRAALADQGPTDLHRMSWRYWDDLPRWSHLRVYRPDAAEEGSAQVTETIGDPQLSMIPVSMFPDGTARAE